MADILADLTRLGQFNGTNVPAAPLNGPCLALFGQLMTHPTRVTYPWPPLRTTLSSYFNTVQPLQATGLDPAKIQSGWCGLGLIATSFRRLEVVQSDVDSQQVLDWLHAIKQAAIVRSLTFRDATSNELYEVINSFKVPISPQDLEQFESMAAQGAAQISAKAAASEVNGSAKRPQPTTTGSSSGNLNKKPRKSAGATAASTNVGSELHGATNDGNMMSSFDQDGIDQLDMSESDEGGAVPQEDGDDYVELQTGATTSQQMTNSKKRKRSSMSVNPGAVADEDLMETQLKEELMAHNPQFATQAVAPPQTTATEEQVPISIQLARKISEVTGISLQKCIESLSRFTEEELSTINPNVPIPPQFLPGGNNANANGGGRGGAGGSSSKPKSSNNNRARSSASVGLEANAGAPLIGSSNTSTPNALPGTPGTSNSILGPNTGGFVGAFGQSSTTTTTTSTSSTTKRPSKSSKPHDPNRPNFSYSALIGQAILGTPDKRARLSEIYDYVMTNYPYYRRNESGWQNSIRHNLSLQPVFRKIPDETQLHNKKSCFWTIKPEEEWRFAGGGWQKLGVGSGNHKRSASKGGAPGGGGGGHGDSASASPAPSNAGAKKGKNKLDDDDDDQSMDGGPFSDED
ncbi:Fork head domain-containing protein [Microbotryomycetes sp. JL221]|nr:Fork head domain-containing protein [Microbotryomycetes sp. JL221]